MNWLEQPAVYLALFQFCFETCRNLCKCKSVNKVYHVLALTAVLLMYLPNNGVSIHRPSPNWLMDEKYFISNKILNMLTNILEEGYL